jgi:hypothetical protein
MDLLFVGLFQNVSYIHPYSAFYLSVPLAIGAGVALDRLIIALQSAGAPRFFRGVAALAAILILAGLGASGWQRTRVLAGQFRILDYHVNEPRSLIPELGEAIRANFSADTTILCNFLPDYGPHLAYYAKRDILNNLAEYRFWHPYINDRARRIGGVVWVSSNPASQNIVAQLPASDAKRFVTVGAHTFCLWMPGASGQTTAANSASSLPAASAPNP